MAVRAVKPKTDTEVADAARAWGRHRLLVLAVKEARNSHQCEYEEAAESDYSTGYSYPGVAPCWKIQEWDYEHEPMNADEWCQPCLQRQKWHLALVTIKRVHGGRLRRLQRVSASPEPLEVA